MNAVQRMAAYVGEARGRSEYLQIATELLTELIGNDAIAWIRVDFDSGLSEVAGTQTGLADDEVARLLLQVADDHPMVQSFIDNPMVGGARRMSELVSDIELHSTEAFRRLIEPVDGHHMLSVPIGQFSKRGTRSWSLNRRCTDFAEADTAMLDLLRPTLALLDRSFADTAVELTAAELYGLTAREVEVLRLSARGITVNAVGHLLGISPRTAAKHLEHAYRKLGSDNRIAALAKAGLLPRSPSGLS